MPAIPKNKKKPKKRLCAVVGCRTRFHPWNSLETVCSQTCAIKKVRQDTVKIKKAQKKRDKLKLDALRPRSYWLKKAQAAFNKYIRARDYGNRCISSGREMNWHQVAGSAVDCGHYRSTGSAPHLRFDCYNAHAQSVKDNRYLSGSVTDYRIFLIKKIGLDKVERLESDNQRRNFDIEYLKRLARIFNKRASFTIKRKHY